MSSSPRRGILLVEDDFSIRETLKYALEHEGYEVSTANNGREGIDFLQAATTPFLVLLDFLMPVMGGAEFLRELHSHAHLAATPVVIVSATLEELGHYQAEALVKKPIDLDLLLNVVSRFVV